MDHSCDKCGTVVEAGVPFCPACGTPQIRVTLPAKIQSLVAAGSQSAASHSPVSALPMGTPLSAERPTDQPPAPGELHWSYALPGAAVAGLVLAMALALPLAAPLLVMLVTGALSQAMYARRTGGSAMTPGMGARTGMIGGFFGWGLIAAIFALELALGGGRLIATLQGELQKQIAANPDPNAQQIMSKLTSSPNGMITVVVFGLALFLVIALAVSAAGGALSARLFGKNSSK